MNQWHFKSFGSIWNVSVLDDFVRYLMKKSALFGVPVLLVLNYPLLCCHLAFYPLLVLFLRIDLHRFVILILMQQSWWLTKWKTSKATHSFHTYQIEDFVGIVALTLLKWFWLSLSMRVFTSLSKFTGISLFNSNIWDAQIWFHYIIMCAFHRIAIVEDVHQPNVHLELEETVSPLRYTSHYVLLACDLIVFYTNYLHRRNARCSLSWKSFQDIYRMFEAGNTWAIIVLCQQNNRINSFVLR